MEYIRRLFRRVIGYNSKLYLYISNLINFIYTIKKENIKTWFILKKVKLEQKESINEVIFKSLEYPIFLRSGTMDSATALNTLIREEYGYIKPKKLPKLMIDAGAYIGDTSIYFMSKYPELNIIALEPNIDTLKVTKMNLTPYGDRVSLLEKGLYIDNHEHFFSGEETGAGISESGTRIPCITVEKIINNFNISKIDILKMDIEGAEIEIFKHNPEKWLSITELLIIEMHGKEAEDIIQPILKSNNFNYERYRGIFFCRKVTTEKL